MFEHVEYFIKKLYMLTLLFRYYSDVTKKIPLSENLLAHCCYMTKLSNTFL